MKSDFPRLLEHLRSEPQSCQHPTPLEIFPPAASFTPTLLHHVRRVLAATAQVRRSTYTSRRRISRPSENGLRRALARCQT